MIVFIFSTDNFIKGLKMKQLTVVLSKTASQKRDQEPFVKLKIRCSVFVHVIRHIRDFHYGCRSQNLKVVQVSDF